MCGCRPATQNFTVFVSDTVVLLKKNKVPIRMWCTQCVDVMLLADLTTEVQKSVRCTNGSCCVFWLILVNIWPQQKSEEYSTQVHGYHMVEP